MTCSKIANKVKSNTRLTLLQILEDKYKKFK